MRATGDLVSAVPCRDDHDHVRLEVGEVIHLPVQRGVRRPNGAPAVGADPSADVVRRLQHLGLWRRAAVVGCDRLYSGVLLFSQRYLVSRLHWRYLLLYMVHDHKIWVANVPAVEK